MFKGDYNFFDYKYNIEGYTGQDFGTLPQYLYLIISIILMISLLIIFRKAKKENVLKVIRIVSVFLILLYITKTIWESINDIKYTGSFNIYLLPFDSCSIIMLASFLAGFTKGKLKCLGECWLSTGGIVGGLATMVVLNAFKYYPFLSFGAFYSMIWHFLMVFLGLFLIVTKYVKIEYKTVLNGYLFHLLFSLIVIPIDFIYKLDFMMYYNLSSIPIFENIGTYLTNNHLHIINTLIMLSLYFIAFNIVFIIPLIVNKKKVVK